MEFNIFFNDMHLLAMLQKDLGRPIHVQHLNMLYDVQSQKILITRTFLEIVHLELYGIHTLQKNMKQVMYPNCKFLKLSTFTTRACVQRCQNPCHGITYFSKSHILNNFAIYSTTISRKS
jgi:hypothetical protein